MRPTLTLFTCALLLAALLAAPVHALQQTTAAPLDVLDRIPSSESVSVDTALRIDAHTRASLRALDRRAQAILDDLFQGDEHALRAALPGHRQEQGADDITRLLHLMSTRYGSVEQITVLGTVPHADDRAWTLAQVSFEHGAEVLRLTWRDDHLLTVQRTAPAVLVD